jgi:alkanesulfonate monooxygenase SsuD/methylene tetrahydromethanopterin reductase-like flavin-dependent oxidoreductase (luciferase family)
VKLGIHFGHFDLSGGTPALAETVANVAQAAEQGDCAIFTLMDHWFQMDRVAPAEEPMLEGYTTPWDLSRIRSRSSPRSARWSCHAWTSSVRCKDPQGLVESPTG